MKYKVGDKLKLVDNQTMNDNLTTDDIGVIVYCKLNDSWSEIGLKFRDNIDMSCDEHGANQWLAYFNEEGLEALIERQFELVTE